MPKRYWLMKCEPAAYTIDDLARDGRTSWEGVRNYQARNFMRDEMKEGDGVLFYASNADPSGVTGLAADAERGAVRPCPFEQAHLSGRARSRAAEQGLDRLLLRIGRGQAGGAGCRRRRVLVGVEAWCPTGAPR